MAFYKRKIFLINPTFQLTFSLIASSLIFLSSLIYPLFLMDFFKELAVRFPQIAPSIQNNQNTLIGFLLIVQLLFVAMVSVIFIILTHKIAGPMHKLKMHLAAIREGKPITQLTFRKGDYFHDVAEEVSLFLETINMNQEADFQYVEEISSYLQNLVSIVPDDKKPILNEINRRLEEIKSRYK